MGSGRGGGWGLKGVEIFQLVVSGRGGGWGVVGVEGGA